MEYTFFVCTPVTSGQDDYRDGREIEVCFQYIQDNEPIPVRYTEIQNDQVWPMLRASEIAPAPFAAQWTS